MTVPATLNNTLGAAFIGTVVAAVLLGVSWAQTLYYFTHQHDTWHIKSTVTVAVILDTFHQILISHTVYTYTVTDWGKPLKIQQVVWSLVVQVLCSGLTALIVQSFLVLRIWRLSHQKVLLTGVCAILTIGGFVTLLVYFGKAIKLKDFAAASAIKAESISVNAIGATTDLLIAITLCILLGLSRTGFKKSDAVIRKLIIFTVNTGLITSLCAIASLISILVAPNTFIYIGFFFCLSRLYTNSLLATLNARGALRGLFASEMTLDTASVSLQTYSKSTMASQGKHVSIKIDTSHHDRYPAKKDSSGSIEETI